MEPEKKEVIRQIIEQNVKKGIPKEIFSEAEFLVDVFQCIQCWDQLKKIAENDIKMIKDGKKPMRNTIMHQKNKFYVR